MRHTYLRGVLASALGGGIGTILALSLGLLWPLGALLGGLVGFLAYHPKEVIAVIPRVWRAASGITIPLPNRDFWSLFGWASLAMAILINTTIMLIAGWISLFTGTLPPDARLVCLGAPTFFGIFGGLLASLTCPPQKRSFAQKDMRQFIRHGNIFSAMFWIIYGLVWLVRKFVPLLLCEVYSDERLVAGVSALSGALTGYRHASVIEGALCAAVLWSVQYAAITVPLKRRLAKSRS